MWRNRFVFALVTSGSIVIVALVTNIVLRFDMVWLQTLAAVLSIVSLAGLAFTGNTTGGRMTARICLGAVTAFGVFALALSPVSIGLTGGITDENRVEIVVGLFAVGLVMVVLPLAAIVASIRKT